MQWSLIREWKCTCPPEALTGFLIYLNKTGVEDTQSIDGCKGYEILQREESGQVEIVLRTIWDSLENMKKYSSGQLPSTPLRNHSTQFEIS